MFVSQLITFHLHSFTYFFVNLDRADRNLAIELVVIDIGNNQRS